MLEKAINYFNLEVNSTTRYFVNHGNEITDNEFNRIVNYAIQRCLGVAYFAQDLGIPYDDIRGEYNATKERLLALLDGKCGG